ncbi:MAG: 2-oxoglutarate dehydrogenase E1 component [Geobacteraceae bacterium]|nr:2-oxoglutarate dehydrogenase E1 component [Geobacteraceae bacterium]
MAHPESVHNALQMSNVSGQWLDSLYQQWIKDPESVNDEWKLFLAGFELGNSAPVSTSPFTTRHNFESLKLSGVQSLIYRYRSLGHLQACTDPLSPCQLDHPLLSLSNFGLDTSDLDISFTCRRYMKPNATLREILSTMQETYCREIGVEFMHIQDPAERQWLIDRMEPCRNRPDISAEVRLHLLEKLHEAALFESFLQRKFIGQKRFSLEGGEILIPVLDAFIRSSPASGINLIVVGMAHRGRLNVLAHILGKPYEDIFAEFRDEMAVGFAGDGDVKYHKGYSADIQLSDGTVHLTLAANPSHLEAVNSVVEGKCRALQDRSVCSDARQVMPLLIHGDSAFAGQGSVMETLNLSRLDGYSTGGTLHIVLNNQIGFTTLPRDARSMLYATDVAKMLACPVFHVQGESPEAALHAVRLALEYRQEFGRDVVMEFICYRRHGHNEGDEPAFTQPLMYRSISTRPGINRIYSDVLLESGITADQLENIEHEVTQRLETGFDRTSQEKSIGFREAWSSVSREYSTEDVDTAVSVEKLLLLSRRLAELPPAFNPHAKIRALVQKRFESVLKNTAIDWGTAENLAYASLLDEGVPVRLSGQDSRRGTFSHRHCVLHDMNDDSTYIPLESVSRDGAVFQVWDSPLSEFAVLGFEYGYSLESPKNLTVWEAQFGDFANGAQVVIDQFIASGETKWNRASGLVLMLPHGYEGQGAEHSSARIERFLQLCADHNMLVVNPTTPSQIFHLLRRQVKQVFRKPLIIFTPKSLLRHPDCVSTVDHLCNGSFVEVISDVIDSGTVRRVLFCSGKIYFDLNDARAKLGRNDTAIVRIEQLYPLRDDLLIEVLAGFSNDVCYRWVQEEPENMGAWPHLQLRLAELCGSVRYVGRPADSCPAVGSHHLHQRQQTEIISRAFTE